MRKALIILSLTLFAGLLFGPVAAQGAITPTKAEQQVIEEVNKERAKKGLAALKFRATLTKAARAHSREMARRGILTHTSANGWTPAQRMRHYGYTAKGCTFWKVGENIACARSGTLYATPVSTVQAWMDSTGHRKIILTASFRDIGVGLATSDSGMRYFTIDLGRRKY
jgi:uncharacterized protein YkwD